MSGETIDAGTGEVVRVNETILAVETAAANNAVDTAKRYPRIVADFLNDLETWSCLDEGTAVSCFYSLPRGGKKIIGASARFAELAVCAWGNIEVGTRVVGEAEGFVIVEGICRDMQKNVSRRDQVRRPILDREGERYQQSVVESTIATATAIAGRNAILKVVPRALWEPVFNKALKLASGSGETTEEKRRVTFEYLTVQLGVPEERLFTYLDGRKVPDWTNDDILALRGKARLLHEGSSTVDAEFPEKLEKDPTSAQDSRAAASQAISGLKTSGQDRPAEGDTEPQPEPYSRRFKEAVEVVGQILKETDPNAPCLQQDSTGARCVVLGPHEKHQRKDEIWEVDAPEPEGQEEPDGSPQDFDFGGGG